MKIKRRTSFVLLFTPAAILISSLNVKAAENVKYALEEPLYFAGQKVPTEYWWVQEGLNDWLLTMQANPATTCKYIRRSAVYEPLIREKLRSAGLPEDLFYIAVIESGLNPSVRSSAKAVGMWQFMRLTGKIYGLHDNVIDERQIVEKATDAAIEHFKDLYGEFKDWFLVGAAYNAGVGRVREVTKAQGELNYWLLHFPKKETEEYMYRAVVMKEVMEHLERYGFPEAECKKTYYPQLKFVKKKIFKSISLIRMVKDFGIAYIEFLELNPAYAKRTTLPPGTYWFLLPADLKEK